MTPSPKLVVYAGPNGAGKSTLRDIGGDLVDMIIDPDRIARELSPNQPDLAQIEAGRAAVSLFQRCVEARKSMSLETTLTGSTVLNRMSNARRAGYDISLRFVALASATLHIDRVRQRVRKGGHDIPRETIERRYEASLDNLPKAIGYADHVTIIDNSGREKLMLLRAEHGAILEISPDQPLWFRSRLPAIRSALAAYKGPPG